MTILTTGQLARQAGVNVETLRYYERQGLLPEPPRSPSGYRRYPREGVARIRFIKRAQELGFSLNEIGELLSLRHDANTTCNEVRERAENKIADINTKLGDLERMRRALVRLAESCPGQGPGEDCPILDYLEEGAP